MKTFKKTREITIAGKYKRPINLYSAILHMTMVGMEIVSNKIKMSNIIIILYITFMVK